MVILRPGNPPEWPREFFFQGDCLYCNCRVGYRPEELCLPGPALNVILASALVECPTPGCRNWLSLKLRRIQTGQDPGPPGITANLDSGLGITMNPLASPGVTVNPASNPGITIALSAPGHGIAVREVHSDWKGRLLSEEEMAALAKSRIEVRTCERPSEAFEPLRFDSLMTILETANGGDERKDGDHLQQVPEGAVDAEGKNDGGQDASGMEKGEGRPDL